MVVLFLLIPVAAKSNLLTGLGQEVSVQILYTSIKLTEQTAVSQKNNCFHFKLLIFEHSSF